MENGSGNGTERLLGMLIERTDDVGRDIAEIKETIQRFASIYDKKHDRVEERITSLEHQGLEARASWKTLAFMGSILTTGGGAVGSYLYRLWGS